MYMQTCPFGSLLCGNKRFWISGIDIFRKKKACRLKGPQVFCIVGSYRICIVFGVSESGL